jgi:hypothetical protein
MAKPSVRHRDPCVPLTKEQFRQRFYARFYAPAYDAVKTGLEKVFDTAWGYIKYRTSPRTRPVEWSQQTRAQIGAAAKRCQNPASPLHMLIVNGFTRGKDPLLAKQLELKGWDYPKHLAGRAFAVVAHGEAPGPENLRRSLIDWLTDIGMIQTGPSATLNTWIGWYRPCATSNDDLNADEDLFVRVGNVSTRLTNMVAQLRAGTYQAPDRGLYNSREK